MNKSIAGGNSANASHAAIANSLIGWSVRIVTMMALLLVCSLPPLLNAEDISLRAWSGHYVCAEGGGGQEVVANRDGIGGWEIFNLNDLNGGSLESGDAVTFQSYSGYYVCAEDGGGREVVANREWAYGWETFTIYKDGGGTIQFGDQISLQSENGQWVCAEGGGGREVVANRDAIGGWEVFTLISPYAPPPVTPPVVTPPPVTPPAVTAPQLSTLDLQSFLSTPTRRWEINDQYMGWNLCYVGATPDQNQWQAWDPGTEGGLLAWGEFPPGPAPGDSTDPRRAFDEMDAMMQERDARHDAETVADIAASTQRQINSALESGKGVQLKDQNGKILLTIGPVEPGKSYIKTDIVTILDDSGRPMQFSVPSLADQLLYAATHNISAIGQALSEQNTASFNDWMSSAYGLTWSDSGNRLGTLGEAQFIEFIEEIQPVDFTKPWWAPEVTFPDFWANVPPEQRRNIYAYAHYLNNHPTYSDPVLEAIRDKFNEIAHVLNYGAALFEKAPLVAAAPLVVYASPTIAIIYTKTATGVTNVYIATMVAAGSPRGQWVIEQVMGVLDDQPGVLKPVSGAASLERLSTIPSSGAVLQATPGITTTILGRYNDDLKPIVNEVTGGLKSWDFGPNPGGFNVLNVPDGVGRWGRDAFWDLFNKPWLDAAIRRGDDIILATTPSPSTLFEASGELTGFGREYQYLISQGYHFDSITNKMVR
ncbi:MAG: hypothetical protein QM760_20215 [Nibricoccus sp.]